MATQAEPVKKLTNEEQYQLMLKHKTRMMPLVKYLKKRGLKFKHASCMKTRVQYFRYDQFLSLVEERKEEIYGNENLKELVETINDDLYFFKRPPNTEKLKYPQNLIPSQTGFGKFASFRFDTTQSKKSYVVLFVILILAGVMFPLWPYQLKYAIWLISLVILILILSIIVVRLIVYLIFASFGISLWIFPNIFGDYGIIESFKPFYSVQKWENNWVGIMLRLAAFSLFIYYSLSIYQEPQLYIENFEKTKDVVQQVHDWGVGKIKGEPGNFSQRALTMQNILNQTADAFEEQPQQGQSTQYDQTEGTEQSQTL